MEAGEVIGDDLVITGESVTIDGVVQGDVPAAGGRIAVNGAIEGDFMAAGQAISIDGVVRDDVRIAGMALRLAGEIGDTLMAAGMSLETEPGSRIGGELSYAGFQALLAGEVAEGARLAAQGIEIGGQGHVALLEGGLHGSGGCLSPPHEVPEERLPGACVGRSYRLLSGRLS